ncbi:hypothetical protein [[Eubacterium] cellulosolvens]
MASAGTQPKPKVEGSRRCERSELATKSPFSAGGALEFLLSFNY